VGSAGTTSRRDGLPGRGVPSLETSSSSFTAEVS
jgi:hypothetical protein